MADGSLPMVAVDCRIPLQQIGQHRAAFGWRRLSYQLELQAPTPWSGVEAFASACRTAGLGLKTLRCGSEGLMVCSLVETEGTDLPRLAAKLRSQDLVQLKRWTTTIEYGAGTASSQ